MEINQKRLDRQNIAIGKWLANYGKGAIEWIPASGKSYIACLVIQRLVEKDDTAVTHVVVPTTKLKKDWTGYFVKQEGIKIWVDGHIQKHNLKNVEVFVINTYMKSNHICDLLVYDEWHRAAAESFINSIKNTTYKWILTLTGTLERLDNRHELLLKYAPIVDILTENDARREGFISNYEIFNLGITLTDKEKIEYAKISELFNHYFKYFSFDFKLALYCSFPLNPLWNKEWYECTAAKFAKEHGYIGDSLTVLVERYKINSEREKINKINQEKNKLIPNTKGNKKIKMLKMEKYYQLNSEHEFHPLKVNRQALLYMQYVQKRKNFCYNLPIKIDYVKEFVKEFPDNRIITFSETSVFADKLKEELGDICGIYHTGISDGLKDLSIYKFENKQHSVLSTVKALNEGLNINGIDMTINLSQNRSKISSRQKRGRGNRIDYSNMNKVAIHINLYIEDFKDKDNKDVFSQEKKTIKENQKGMKSVIWVKSVNEIVEWMKNK